MRLRRGALADAELAGDFVQILIGDTGVGDLDHLEHVRAVLHHQGGKPRLRPRPEPGPRISASSAGRSRSRAPSAKAPRSPSICRGPTFRRGSARRPNSTTSWTRTRMPGAADVLVVDDEVEVAPALQTPGIGRLQGEDGGGRRRGARRAEVAHVPARAHRRHHAGHHGRRGSRARSASSTPACRSSSLPATPWWWRERASSRCCRNPSRRDLRAAIQRYLTPGDEENRVVPLFPRRSS